EAIYPESVRRRYPSPPGWGIPRLTLTQILTYHVVPGKVLSNDLKAGEVVTVEGSPVEISLADGVKVNDANVVTADIEAVNGVIHVIDKVILPPQS
ncbi:fasciclin domain-containing protein, partial [Synechococcus sp. H60.2]|uniref:fasciclin domain-containing protein n=1 Tax=Synechococcus sp. H60.2 TaxID=2964518 RepID=UPI0039C0AEE3